MAHGNLPVRPTTDFAKSGLFNILNNYFEIENLKILDLCCGIGSIAFEFASRGAAPITCVDEHAGCLKFINETAERLGIHGITTIKADIFDYVEREHAKYDIIFADPPFASEATDNLPDKILERKLLHDGGWLIVEHQSKRTLKSKAQPFQVRKYEIGRAHV